MNSVRADERRSKRMPRICLYLRISTDELTQKYSLGAQKERLEAACKAQYGDDWTLYKVYRDTDSGGHVDRPGLTEMLDDAKARAFDVLLVFKVDRLSRNIGQLAAMVDQLTECGVTLRSITEPFDTSSLAGRMMLQMLGVFANSSAAPSSSERKSAWNAEGHGPELRRWP